MMREAKKLLETERDSKKYSRKWAFPVCDGLYVGITPMRWALCGDHAHGWSKLCHAQAVELRPARPEPPWNIHAHIAKSENKHTSA
jgi:hypothetical protein